MRFSIADGRLIHDGNDMLMKNENHRSDVKTFYVVSRVLNAFYFFSNVFIFKKMTIPAISRLHAVTGNQLLDLMFKRITTEPEEVL